MDRRSLLRLTGGCLALPISGCVTRSGEGPPLNNSNTADGPPDSAKRKVSIGNLDRPADDVPVSIVVEVDRPWITAEKRATLSLSYSNTGSSTYEYQQPFYEGASSWFGEPGILLYDVDALASPPRDPPECWTTEQPSKDSLAWSALGPPNTELAPGERRSVQLIVVDDPSVEGCFPTGTYQFGSKRGVGKMSYEWSFTLEVTEIEDP